MSEKFIFSDSSPEQDDERIRDLIGLTFSGALIEGDVDKALSIIEKIDLSNADYKERIQNGVKSGISNAIGGRRGYQLGEAFKIDTAIAIKEKFNLPQDAVEEAVNRGIEDCLTRKDVREEDFDKINSLKEKFNLSEDSFVAAIKEGVDRILSGGYEPESNGSYFAVKVAEKFNLPDDFLKSEKIMSDVINRADRRVRYDIDDAVFLKEKFNLPEDVSADVAGKGMIRQLGFYMQVEGERKNDEGFRENIATDNLRAEAIKKAIEIKEKFGLSKEFSNLSIREAIINIFNVNLYGGRDNAIVFATEIQKAFDLSEKNMQDAIEGAVERVLQNNRIDDAIMLGKKFNLPENIIKEKAEKIMWDILDTNPPEYDDSDSSYAREELECARSMRKLLLKKDEQL